MPFRRGGFLPLPDGHVLVVGGSGVTARKTGRARESYNRASRLAAQAADLWRDGTGEAVPHLADLVERRADASTRIVDLAGGADADADALRRRVEHLATEHLRCIPDAWRALEGGDLAAFGDAVGRSQEAAEILLGNQVPETMHLARSARELGAVAASAFGAGFGGAVWALVEEKGAELFVSAWRSDYRAAYPNRSSRARFFIDPTGPAALRLDGSPVW